MDVPKPPRRRTVGRRFEHPGRERARAKVLPTCCTPCRTGAGDVPMLSRRSLLKLSAAGILAALMSAAATAADTIKIGTFLSVTGPGSSLGDPELKTLQLYVEEINAAGGVLGRKLELVHYDSGANPKNAINFVKRLVQRDRVDVIVGGSTSGETMAVIPIVEEAGVPFISLAGAIEI